MPTYLWKKQHNVTPWNIKKKHLLKIIFLSLCIGKKIELSELLEFPKYLSVVFIFLFRIFVLINRCDFLYEANPNKYDMAEGKFPKNTKVNTSINKKNKDPKKMKNRKITIPYLCIFFFCVPIKSECQKCECVSTSFFRFSLTGTLSAAWM